MIGVDRSKVVKYFGRTDRHRRSPGRPQVIEVSLLSRELIGLLVAVLDHGIRAFAHDLGDFQSEIRFNRAQDRFSAGVLGGIV
jgi:hypothetical protein